MAPNAGRSSATPTEIGLTLLSSTAGRSDDPSLQSADEDQLLTVYVETLLPVQSYPIEMAASETVAVLRERFLRARAADMVVRPTGKPPQPELSLTMATAVAAAGGKHANASNSGWSSGDHIAISMVDGIGNTSTICTLCARCLGTGALESHWRLIHDGNELTNPTATLQAWDLTRSKRAVGDGVSPAHGSGAGSGGLAGGRVHVVAIEQRWRGGLAGLLGRWWPFLLIVCLLMSLVAVGSLDTSRAMTAQATPLASNGHGDRKRCGQPIRVFVIIAPLLLLPYGLVLSGVVQPERAHRLLWWWKHPWLRRLVGGSAACASIWLALGGNWLFAADSTCALVEPRLHASAALLWALLLLANVPMVIALMTPCLIPCNLPVAFKIVAFMAGQHRTEGNSMC